MATEKCLYAYDYVDLKDREYVKKHTKQRHLGDIGRKHHHRPRPSTATVVNSLVSLDFPESRAINTTTANRIISDQHRQIRHTYEKTQWKETLTGWSRPSTSMEERAPTPLDIEQRPHTSASISIPDGTGQLQMNPLNVRPFSTGAVRKPSRKPPQASGFMWVRMKRSGNRSSGGGNTIQFKRITEEIRQQWEAEDRRASQEQRRERGQSPRSCNAFAGQWLSFAAGGADDDEGATPGGMTGGDREGEENQGGVVEAFTGKTNSEFYNIEGKVGANVATQLRIGNKIRIGVNGSVQSESLRVRKWRKEIERVDSAVSSESFATNDSDLFRLSGQASKPKKKVASSSPAVPLCWDDQLSQPDVRVLEVLEKPPPSAKPDLSERHPVVFERLVKDGVRPKRGPKLETYRLGQRAKTKRNLDGTASLSNRITVLTVDQVPGEDDAGGGGGQTSPGPLDYEAILQRSLEPQGCPRGEGEKEEEEEEGAPPALLRHPEEGVVASSKAAHQRLSPYGETAGEARVGSGASEKPSMPRCSPRHSSAGSEAGLAARGAGGQGASPTPRPRSMPLASPVPSSPSIVGGRPRPGTGSQQSQRAQSGKAQGRGHARYNFSQPATPRNLHSPHPNLARPGQLPRTGVSSINPGLQEGEHEYIKISQPILPGSERDPSPMESAIARVRAGQSGTDVTDSPSSVASFDSGDSMNVEGDRAGRGLPEDLGDLPSPAQCGCSPEARRAVSAALSRTSFSSARAISIPTAPEELGLGGSLSDLNSVSEMDPLASYSSFRGSLSSDIAAMADLAQEDDAEDEDSANFGRALPTDESHDDRGAAPITDEPDPSHSERAAGRSARSGVSSSAASSASSQRRPPSSTRDGPEELGYIINRVDGLELTGTEQDLAERPRKLPSAKKGGRTVTFAEEEVRPPSVPNCTPESTPRDAMDSGANSPDLNPTHRPQLSDQRPASGGSTRSDERSALRSKIKSDLIETQQVTQQDLAALAMRRNSGKT